MKEVQPDLVGGEQLLVTFRFCFFPACFIFAVLPVAAPQVGHKGDAATACSLLAFFSF